MNVPDEIALPRWFRIPDAQEGWKIYIVMATSL
jgi:hypothetical protein